MALRTCARWMPTDQFAWQVFDNKIIPMLRDEYRTKRVTKVRAGTLEELCNKLENVNSAKALETR
jgi:tricarballylate dehydrogenase